MVKIQISSDKKMGKVKTMVLPAKRNSDKTTTKKSNKLALTTESKSYIKKAKSIYWGTPLNIYIPLMKAGYYDPFGNNSALEQHQRIRSCPIQ